jgi:hypothetical protein
MSESAIYEFGSKVFCTDADCGELLQFVVEPGVPRLTDLVVSSATDRAAHLVAACLARPTRYGILLDCDRGSYDCLPAAPLRDLSDTDARTRIRRGDRVGAMDGDAGRVLGLVVRGEDAAITHLLLVSGRIWHRRLVAVPVDYVAGLGFSALDVLLTKDRVADFAVR